MEVSRSQAAQVLKYRAIMTPLWHVTRLLGRQRARSVDSSGLEMGPSGDPESEGALVWRVEEIYHGCVRGGGKSSRGDGAVIGYPMKLG